MESSKLQNGKSTILTGQMHKSSALGGTKSGNQSEVVKDKLINQQMQIWDARIKLEKKQEGNLASSPTTY